MADTETIKGHGMKLDVFPFERVHGPDCQECHNVERTLSADRCCAFHYRRRFGRGWAEYQQKVQAVVEARWGET